MNSEKFGGFLCGESLNSVPHFGSNVGEPRNALRGKEASASNL